MARRDSSPAQDDADQDTDTAQLYCKQRLKHAAGWTLVDAQAAPAHVAHRINASIQRSVQVLVG
ncbi:hypothetical protein E4U11_007799 [Claviceps purpurea]|nr:hypothetical protein E4U11_007799 [Claviceps purpurea]